MMTEITTQLLNKKTAKILKELDSFIEYYNLSKNKFPDILRIFAGDYVEIKRQMLAKKHEEPFTYKGILVDSK